ncbi:uncharacterized protein BJ171DRAFT_425841 [Polychytrium aggregatum]|uniref:uncharacterized protein n=1 Tax=Polychytrium aggregatum TaxID=110093 RepID=UPI0022FF1816|nr:uncharacterized protein BJ171DRAFT_425841 [Polychytrium aggregatum]KAI9203030.1 hypothetical protein BJ171DRAFT_425841 [Polychytrium aggregatum]
MGYPSFTVEVVLYYVTLALFFAIGCYAGFRARNQTKDSFLSARGTQGWFSLGANFFASGLGVWTIFTLPQVGSDPQLGVVGAVGYAIACIAPILLLAWMGPAVRRWAPNGVTVTDFVLMRFGWSGLFLTVLISIVYMTVYLSSELTALGGFLSFCGFSTTQQIIAQVIVCICTATYTAVGGMPASLITDKFQSFTVLALFVIASIGFGLNVTIPASAPQQSNLYPTRVGWESIVTLTCAVTFANIFHQGYWQRVYSSKDDRELRNSTYFASALTFPMFLLIGLAGTLSVWAGLTQQMDGGDYNALFNVTATLPDWVNGFVVILVSALICSSVDTLQSALTASIVNDLSQRKLNLKWARLIAALINVPALLIAAMNAPILSLFLMADLFAGMIAAPILIGFIPSLRHVVNGFDFLLGFVGSILSVFFFGWIWEGNAMAGLLLLMPPLSVPGESIGAFLIAPIAGIFFSVLSAYIRRGIRRLRGLEVNVELTGRPTIWYGYNAEDKPKPDEDALKATVTPSV